MKVWVVLNNEKSSYDAGGIFESVHSTLESAEREVAKWGTVYPPDREIQEEELQN